MEHDPSGQGSLNISDVIEVIQTTDPEFASVNTMFAGGGMGDPRKKSIYVKILEQPASKALRFRYECEGRSAGSIPGVNSTPENKTFPTIQIVGYNGPAVVVVSCVTKDVPHRPHPHNLVGKEGCKKGICTMRINSENMTVTFSNLGIQCVKKKDIEDALKVREEIKVDPFRTGFSHRNQPTSIDLNAVRLCFQVFIEDGERNRFTLPLTPVVSDPIYDKKAMSDLVICKLSHYTCSAAGGQEIILLCEKVAKEDIQVYFYEEQNGVVVWEGYGDFQPTHVHKQVAISFRTPSYKTLKIEAPVKINIQLRRPSDGATSEALPFEYRPLDSDQIESKRRCIDQIESKRRKLIHGGKANPHVDSENLRLQQHAVVGGDQSQVTSQLLPIIKREPTEPKLPPPYVFQGGSRSPYNIVAASPSPQPSLSPQSMGRTPSPMDYGATIAHHYPGMHGGGVYDQGAVTYMPARHSDFMSAGKVIRNLSTETSVAGGRLGQTFQGVNDLGAAGGGMTFFDNSPGMSNIGHHNVIFASMGANIEHNPNFSIPSSAGMATMPNSGMVMNNMNIESLAIAQAQSHIGNSGATPMDLGSGVGLVNVSVSVASAAIPGSSISTNTGPTLSETIMLDLDSQQPFNLDSGDLNMANELLDANLQLSENLTNCLSLSENKQQQQMKEMEPTENMTDSFTSLTKEISTLNAMYKGGGNVDDQ